MYRIEDDHGIVQAKVEDLKVAEQLATAYGICMLHKVIQKCEETDKPAALELKIGVYPYNKDPGQCRFDVSVMERIPYGDYATRDYYTVIMED